LNCLYHCAEDDGRDGKNEAAQKQTSEKLDAIATYLQTLMTEECYAYITLTRPVAIMAGINTHSFNGYT
jgi:hypothetical protein